MIKLHNYYSLLILCNHLQQGHSVNCNIYFGTKIAKHKRFQYRKPLYEKNVAPILIILALLRLQLLARVKQE